MPIKRRSKRIAAQPLAHIPFPKWGEVFLMQRLGIVSPPAPVSPAPKGILDTLRSGTLSSTQVEALDALFLVFKKCVRELFVEDL